MALCGELALEEDRLPNGGDDVRWSTRTGSSLSPVTGP